MSRDSYNRPDFIFRISCRWRDEEEAVLEMSVGQREFRKAVSRFLRLSAISTNVKIFGLLQLHSAAVEARWRERRLVREQ